MSEVVITGLGALSCLGNGVDAFARGMDRASSAPVTVADPHAKMPHPLMYAIPDADLPDRPRSHGGRAWGPASRFAVEAAEQALADARLNGVDPSRTSVVVGTGMGDAGLHEDRRSGSATSDARGWSPEFSVASAVGAWLGVGGANVSVSNACAASGFGLSVAADLIRTGEADVVIAGSAEAYSRVALACFNRLGAIDPERCRPFDRHRRGTVFGEGAAMLVLESGSRARERGARGYAAIAGSGWSCDAHHSTAPEPAGTQIIRAMREALGEAHLDPDQVGCVVPHGTGTELNDVVESQALQQVFGLAPAVPPLYSLKGLIGHTGGGAGALAALAAALIVDRRRMPPNVPLDEPDPECAVAVPPSPTALRGSAALVNAYAFGGNNVSLVLREVDR